MASQLAPNLNIQYKWSLGEDNWNTGMDENLLKIDSLLHLTVISKDLNSPPSTIVSGDRYIVGASPINEWQSNQNNIALYYNSVWNFYTPKPGHISYITDINKLYIYDTQNTWTEIQTDILQYSTKYPIWKINTEETIVVLERQEYSINSGILYLQGIIYLNMESVLVVG